MKERVALYSLGIGIFALAGAIFNHLAYGKPIRHEALVMIPFLSLVFGSFIWLRWDWAKAQRSKQMEQAAKKDDDH